MLTNCRPPIVDPIPVEEPILVTKKVDPIQDTQGSIRKSLGVNIWIKDRLGWLLFPIQHEIKGYCDVGDNVVMVKNLSFRRENCNIGDFFHIGDFFNGSVTNIAKLSPTKAVSNIRHQHRCSHTKVSFTYRTYKNLFN